MIKNQAKRRKNANNNNNATRDWEREKERKNGVNNKKEKIAPYTKTNLFCNSFLKHNHLRPFF